MNEDRVELRVVADRALAFQPVVVETPEPLATARKAVPLLWLALYDYAEAEVRRSETVNSFAAVTPVATAVARVAALLAIIPEQDRALTDALQAMKRALDEAPAEQLLVLYPINVFSGLDRESGQAYLQQLVGLCDVWEKVRQGLAWPEAQTTLARVCPDLPGVLRHKDPHVGGYYLVGSLVDRQPSIDDYLLREGQGQLDLEPEALAAGEQGLLIGRFGGRWRLMSSGTSCDLLGIWGEGGTAFVVGRGGTVLRLRKGRCSAMEVPTTTHLTAVWGLSLKFVCAVGEGGTLLAYNGKSWQLWPLPTRAALQSVGGAGPDSICIAAHDAAMLRFDGRSWNRTPLPEETMVNQICADETTIYAVGGSRRGAELLRLERTGWARDERLPRVEWLEGASAGWGSELRVAPGSGPILVRKSSGWVEERIPADRLTAMAGGAMTMALGTAAGYNVVLTRGERGWQVECSVGKDLKLSAIWVAGRPKPPRINTDGGENPPSKGPA
jgi:hypothetical protein